MHIAEQGFTAFLPVIERRRSIGRRAALCLDPLFPGYLFAAFDRDDSQWRALHHMRGVSRVLCGSADVPSPVPAGFVERLQERANADGVLIDERIPAVLTYAAGDQIYVHEGAFSGFSGTVIEDLDCPEGRISLLLRMFGRNNRIRVPTEHVSGA
jgi:transcriptional antiterminator RfaH